MNNSAKKIIASIAFSALAAGYTEVKANTEENQPHQPSLRYLDHCTSEQIHSLEKLREIPSLNDPEKKIQTPDGRTVSYLDVVRNSVLRQAKASTNIELGKKFGQRTSHAEVGKIYCKYIELHGEHTYRLLEKTP